MTDDEPRLGIDDIAQHVEEEVIPHATRTAQRVGSARNRRWRWFWALVILMAVGGLALFIGTLIPHNNKLISDKNGAKATASANASVAAQGQDVAGQLVSACNTDKTFRATHVALCGQAAVLVTVTPTPGAQGPGGPEGKAGPSGPVGPVGPQGLPGERGAAGTSVTGPPGPEGKVGPTGPNGQTITGPAGENGGQGPAGDTVTGPPGAQGNPGADGKDGQDGKDGTNGTNGADAPTITGVEEDQGACTITLTMSDGSAVSGPIHGTLMCP